MKILLWVQVKRKNMVSTWIMVMDVDYDLYADQFEDKKDGVNSG